MAKVTTPSNKKADAKAGADQARIPAHEKAKDAAAPKTDDIEAIAPLSGVDRSGLGEKGWAEVPADRIGGHPELETAPKSPADGDLNGPQPETDLRTGAARVKQDNT
jgi:hypothetical protein